MLARHLFVGLMALAVLPPWAASLSTELKPGDAVGGRIHTGDFVFTISSERRPAGDAAFRILITEATGHFNEQTPAVMLSRVVESSTPNDGWTQRITPFQTLSAERSTHSALCNFMASRQLVKDPDVAFVFTNPTPERLVDGRLMRMPSASVFFARLRGFAK